jgi:predicted nicotinamide N-methyase
VDTVDLIRTHTRLTQPSYVPEVVLYLGDDVIALWEYTEKEAGTPLAPPFWAFAWAGGQALARYLLDHPDLVAGRTVLDLAAGGGVVAIAAAKAGAARVTAAEIDPAAIAAIELNAAANAVTVERLLGDVLDGDAHGADLVTAGDVFYSREMATRMLAFLERVAARGARVLVGDPGRAYVPSERLTALASYQVPTTYDLESAEMRTATVWELVDASGRTRPRRDPS